MHGVDRDSVEIPNGKMSLGGYSNMHHTTPMVYAKQRTESDIDEEADDEPLPEGSFSVYIRKMYLRMNGGLSAVVEEPPVGDDDDYINPQYVTVAVNSHDANQGGKQVRLVSSRFYLALT